MKGFFLGFLLLISGYCYSINLTIGTAPQNPPFGDLADNQNNFFGFDIDIMMEICKRINAQCAFKPIVFNQLFPDVQDGSIDLAIGAITITPDRSENFLFSLPYMESNARFLTLATSTINLPDDIKGKIVGVRKGTPFKTLALSIYPGVTIKEYDMVSDVLEALKSKAVDVVILNDASAKYWAANNSDVYKIVGSSLPVGDGYAIMANKRQVELISQINTSILEMEADGTYLSIYSRYFGN
ncbi:arginine 3rd transport system periplasmic binding protein (plasmid) [Legionella adelaidensis]|uniref:Arginine 3rd transport system periplasmic binding protein n=1 Tax=Legionella adelaidensis TaxID=45056 RepID=A0A0W0R1F8_9GAMM|nr:transporter substrate-binding domain-containing protein [Legionella adelaidensis]KTC64885.1 arginine 3rd transport system periplasmic binding protein [Legionella adelaidensis]VEH82944.1 arginine 3rd transport system periplasmic binding protein [Legionella adelaidensis]